MALALAACGVAAGSSVRIDQAENAPRPPERAGQVRRAASDQETLVAVIAAVRADAARAARAVDALALGVTAVAVTWADGALGCPQPGRMYTQALVAGWRLEVRSPGLEAVYHASRQGQWLWCPTGRGLVPKGAEPAVR